MLENQHANGHSLGIIIFYRENPLGTIKFEKKLVDTQDLQIMKLKSKYHLNSIASYVTNFRALLLHSEDPNLSLMVIKFQVSISQLQQATRTT